MDESKVFELDEDSKVFEMIEEIKSEFGWPVVDLELEDHDIYKILEASLKFLKKYITLEHMCTVNVINKGRVDLSKLGISYITDVSPSESGYDTDSSDSLDDISVITLASSEAKKTFLNDLRYQWIKPYLYIDYSSSGSSSWMTVDNGGGGASSRATIRFVKDYKTSEELLNDDDTCEWSDFLKRIAVSKVKRVLGRIRTKYKPQNSGYDMDGDTLLAEAESDLVTIKQELEDSSTGFFPI